MVFATVWQSGFCAHFAHEFGTFFVNSFKKCYSASFARDRPFQRKEVQIIKKCTMSICTQNFGYERRSRYIYVYYTVMRCMLVMRVRVLVCLLCRPILPCSQYTMEVFFFFSFFVFQPGFVAFVGVWLLWLYHALPIYLSIFLSFFLSYLSNLIYLILSI